MFQQGNIQTPGDMSPQMVMSQMIRGYWISQLIYAVAKLGIADLLKDEPLKCDNLASVTGTHARSLYRVMRALASVGIFAENEQGNFTLTPLAACLRSNVPNSIRASAILLGEENYRAWEGILHSIHTGASAFEHLYGMDWFHYYAQSPERSRVFSENMTNISARENTAVTKGYDRPPLQGSYAGGRGHLC